MAKFLSSSRSSSPIGSKEKPATALRVRWVSSWLFFSAGCLLGYLHGEMTNARRCHQSFDTGTSTFQPTSSSSPKSDCNEIDFRQRYRWRQVHVDDGWRSVDVFFGKTDHLDRTLPRDEEGKLARWFSQAAQDELVSGLLRGKQNGYFIDLAANDATVFSNTYALEQRYGWYVHSFGPLCAFAASFLNFL